MNEENKLNLDKIAKIAEQLNIQLLYFFGSYAQNTMHAQSDIDIAYDRQKPFSNQEYLAFYQTMQKSLNSSRPLDIIYLRSTSPLLAYQIITEGELIYEQSPAADYFERYTIKRYIDAKPLFQATHDYVTQKLNP